MNERSREPFFQRTPVRTAIVVGSAAAIALGTKVDVGTARDFVETQSVNGRIPVVVLVTLLAFYAGLLRAGFRVK